uniref:Small ribosomal subunit protein mS29 n=1 Tax=Parastrongyloides trichosuri TaxID=131310 RepID=A0A0N5A1F4_PARTI
MLKKVFFGSRNNVVFIRNIMASTNEPSKIQTDDNGKLYTVPLETTKQLCFNKVLPSKYISQVNTLSECTWMVRKPLLKILETLSSFEKDNNKSQRIVLWGNFGTGKSITLCQLLHYAHTQNWIIMNVRGVMDITRVPCEIQTNEINGKFDTPDHAVKALTLFKNQNQHIWNKISELKTEKEYIWTKVDKTGENRPISDIVEMGISAPFVATDCFGALIKELKRHSTNGDIKMLVAIDQANSMYGKTTYKRPDGGYALPGDLSMIYHLKQFLKDDWTNGITVMVADESEVKNARDMLTVPLVTPLELFGEEGFEDIVPFIPIETKNYDEKEIDVIYEYYKSKNWLTTPDAKTENGKKQMFYISAFNPYNFERLCAFV